MPITNERARAIFNRLDEGFLESAGPIADSYIVAVATRRRNNRSLAKAIIRLHPLKIYRKAPIKALQSFYQPKDLLQDRDVLLGVKRRNALVISKGLLRMQQVSAKLLTFENISKFFANPSQETVNSIIIKYRFVTESVDKSKAKALFGKIESFGEGLVNLRILRDISQMKDCSQIFAFLKNTSTVFTAAQIKSILTSANILAISRLSYKNSGNSVSTFCEVLSMLFKNLPSSLTQANITRVLRAKDMYRALVTILLEGLRVVPSLRVVDRLTANIGQLKKILTVEDLPLSFSSDVDSVELVALETALRHRSILEQFGDLDQTFLGTEICLIIQNLVKAELDKIIANSELSNEQKFKYFYSLHLIGFRNYSAILTDEHQFDCLTSPDHQMTMTEALKLRGLFILGFWDDGELNAKVYQELVRIGYELVEPQEIALYVLSILLDLKGLGIELSSSQRQQLISSDISNLVRLRRLSLQRASLSTGSLMSIFEVEEDSDEHEDSSDFSSRIASDADSDVVSDVESEATVPGVTESALRTRELAQQVLTRSVSYGDQTAEEALDTSSIASSTPVIRVRNIRIDQQSRVLSQAGDDNAGQISPRPRTSLHP